MNMRSRLRIKTLKAMNRSGKQTCPICLQKSILIEHHINGHDIPNPEHPSNKAYICDNDHRLIHEGKIILEGNFKTTNGIELFYHYAGEESFSGQDAQPYIIGGQHVVKYIQ
jgi:hypothetical protein